MIKRKRSAVAKLLVQLVVSKVQSLETSETQEVEKHKQQKEMFQNKDSLSYIFKVKFKQQTVRIITTYIIKVNPALKKTNDLASSAVWGNGFH